MSRQRERERGGERERGRERESARERYIRTLMYAIRLAGRFEALFI